MQQRLLFAVFAIFCYVNRNDAKRLEEKDIPYVLSQLFENNSKPPIVLYFEPKPAPKLRNLDDIDSRELEIDDGEPYLRTTQNDERAYILYHLLRSTLEDDDIDPTTANNLQYTKSLLRQALIGRCRNLNKCMRKCPTISFTCTIKCKQVFDDLDACDEPKPQPKCKKPKCGNTMPPAWLY